jgi:hypothetical protein
LIYNADFVWLHFPKCAGTTIEKIFAEYLGDVPGLIQDPVTSQPGNTVNWHDSVKQREEKDAGFRLGDRKVICCFRRLPAWLESRYLFEVSRSPQLPHDPQTLLKANFLEHNGYLNNADYYTRTFLPETLVDSGRVEIIRLENFMADFRKVFGSYLDVSGIPDTALAVRHNPSEKTADNPARAVIGKHVEEIYRHAPYWKTLEAQFY